MKTLVSRLEQTVREQRRKNVTAEDVVRAVQQLETAAVAAAAVSADRNKQENGHDDNITADNEASNNAPNDDPQPARKRPLQFASLNSLDDAADGDNNNNHVPSSVVVPASKRSRSEPTDGTADDEAGEGEQNVDGSVSNHTTTVEPPD